MLLPRNIAAAWKSTGWYVTPRSARDVLAVLTAIGVHSVGQRFAWRGLGSTEFELSSSLHRHLGPGASESDVRAAEEELIGEARRWGLGSGTTTYVDDLKLLADLQHYGLPTRLIDFSRSPLTALWFACQPAPDDADEKSGVVLAVNVTKLDEYSTVRDERTWTSNGYGPSANLVAALAGGKAFVVTMAHPNDRLRAQEGLFIAAPTPSMSAAERASAAPFGYVDIPSAPGDPEDLARRLAEVRGPGQPIKIPFVAVIVSARLKRKLLSYLEASFNKNAQALFPDFAGFREHRRG